MSLKKIAGLASLIITVLTILFGCAIEKVIQVANNPVLPSWEWQIIAPIFQKELRIDDLLFDEDKMDIGTMIEGSFPGGGAEFRRNPADGTYEISFKYDFPSYDGLSGVDLKTDILNTFTNESFTYDSIVPQYLNEGAYWPIPKKLDLIDDNTDDGKIFFNLLSEQSLIKDLTIDLSKASIEKDINGDGSDDILFKGVRDEQSKIILKFSLIENDTVVSGVLENGDIGEIYLEMEGVPVAFTLKTIPDDANDVDYTTFDNYKTDELVYTGEFPCPLYFNGAEGDINYNEYKIEDFYFSLNCVEASNDSDYHTNNVLKLRVSSKIYFSDELAVIGVFYPMTFDLGFDSMDEFNDLASFLDRSVDENASEFEKFQSQLFSSISLSGLSMNLDVTNDLPFTIDLTKMFDNTLNFNNLPTSTNQYPIDNIPDPSADSSKEVNSGMFSYFDTNGDGMIDDYRPLYPKNNANLIISKRNGDSPSYSRIELNDVGDFLQIENSDSSGYTVSRKMYFGRTIDIPGSTEDVFVDVSQFSRNDIIQLGAEIIIPFSMKLFGDYDPFDLAKAIGISSISEVIDVSKSLPFEKLKDITLYLDIENALPIGLEFEMYLITDMTSDTRKDISLAMNQDKVVIHSGNLSLKPDSNLVYYVTSHSDNAVR
ncbi:MAG: hypothetical protein KA885_14200, partial [Spirochaetes bacterium]|nr:hypothetical protein [Spirochaetota bacterium]